MRFFYILTLLALLIFSCYETSEESETIENGRLYTLNHGIFRTRVASDDWDKMNYGFDAISNNSKSYISVEELQKNNTFLLLAAPNSKDLYQIESVGYLVDVTRGRSFDIPDPSKPGVNITAIRHTVESVSGKGSEKITISRMVQSMLDGSYHLIDLETLEFKDDEFWDRPGVFRNPITLEAKVYPKKKFPTLYVYKLYGTNVDIDDSKEHFNKILSQAVCNIDDLVIAEEWPHIDKNWDKNGNGKLDIWTDEQNSADEFNEIKEWAKIKDIWSNERIGAVILEQEFEVHNSSGVLVHGMAHENFIVLSSSMNNRVFCHEYLHTSLGGDLRDVTDEFNVMYYTDDFNQERLRYRAVTMCDGGNEEQWKKLSGENF